MTLNLVHWPLLHQCLQYLHTDMRVFLRYNLRHVVTTRPCNWGDKTLQKIVHRAERNTQTVIRAGLEEGSVAFRWNKMAVWLCETSILPTYYSAIHVFTRISCEGNSWIYMDFIWQSNNTNYGSWLVSCFAWAHVVSLFNLPEGEGTRLFVHFGVQSEDRRMLVCR